MRHWLRRSFRRERRPQTGPGQIQHCTRTAGSSPSSRGIPSLPGVPAFSCQAGRVPRRGCFQGTPIAVRRHPRRPRDSSEYRQRTPTVAPLSRNGMAASERYPCSQASHFRGRPCDTSLVSGQETGVPVLIASPAGHPSAPVSVIRYPSFGSSSPLPASATGRRMPRAGSRSPIHARTTGSP